MIIASMSAVWRNSIETGPKDGLLWIEYLTRVRNGSLEYPIGLM